MSKEFRSAFIKTDLISADTVSLLPGQPNKVGEYQVEAGELVGIGYGRESGQENAQGRIYMDLKDADGNPVPGVVRLDVWSPQNHHLRTLAEYRTEALSTSTDRTKQIPFPFSFVMVSEDKKLVLNFIPDAQATISRDKSTIHMDLTRKYI